MLVVRDDTLMICDSDNLLVKVYFGLRFKYENVCVIIPSPTLL